MESSFETLGRALTAQLEAISSRLGHLAEPRPQRGAVTAGSGFGVYAEGVRSSVLPRLRALAEEAQEFVRRAQRADPARQEELQTAAGRRYQAAMIVAQAVRLEVNVAIVGSHADAAGVPFGAVKARLERLDQDLLPMVQAALSFEPDKMRWAVQALGPLSETVTAELDQAMQAIGNNAEVSHKVIATANVLLLALSLYHVWRLPVIDGGSGGASTSWPPPIMGVVGGAAVAGRGGIDVQAVTATVEAVKKLVDIGALDPVLIGGMIGIGGVAGTAPALEKPLLMVQEGAGGPRFETIRGGPQRQGKVAYIGKGAVIRHGPGGLKERLRLTFRRVARQRADFVPARRQFLRELAKDPRVRSFFGEGSRELARLEAGKTPGAQWEVHHNIPATIEAPEIAVNDQSNFSLLPLWLHRQVSKEWEAFIARVVPGKSATFEFPIFDRFVPSHGAGQ